MLGRLYDTRFEQSVVTGKQFCTKEVCMQQFPLSLCTTCFFSSLLQKGHQKEIKQRLMHRSSDERLHPQFYLSRVFNGKFNKQSSQREESAKARSPGSLLVLVFNIPYIIQLKFFYYKYRKENQTYVVSVQAILGCRHT